MDSATLLTVFDGLIEKYNKDTPLSVDVEHDERGTFVLCGFYSPNGRRVYSFTDLDVLRSVDIQSLALIAHNGVGDFDCLRQWGINVQDSQLYWDTQLVAHILDSSRTGYGLKKLAIDDLGISYPSYDDIVGKRTEKQKKDRVTLDKQPVDLVLKYNAMDTYATWRLYERQVQNLY